MNELTAFTPHVYWVALLPLLAAPVVLFLGRKLPMQGAPVSIGAIGGALVLALYNARQVFSADVPVGANSLTLEWLSIGVPGIGPLSIPVGWINDPLAAGMLCIVTFVSLMVQIYSTGYMAHDEPRRNHVFFFGLSFFSFAMLALVLSNNLISMYMSWELVGLGSYLLIGFWFFKPSASKAAVKAFWVTRVGDFGFLLGILLLFKWTATNTGTGVTSYEGLFDLVGKNAIPVEVITAATLLIFCGAIGKSAQFPLHVWLPDAMEGPTPVSALIHAATMVAAGIYMVARSYPLFSASPMTMETVAAIGAISAFIPATIAVVNTNIKRVMAYSTISQLGFMMLALGCGEYGYTAGMFHLTTHAFFKALLFLAAGSVIHAVHSEEMGDMGRLLKRMPLTAVTCGIGVLALAGIPPFAGYFSKDAVMTRVWASGHTGLFAIALFTVFLTAFYSTRMWVLTFWGHKDPHGHPHESPPSMTVPLVILAALSCVAGFFGHAYYEHVHVGPAQHHDTSVAMMALGTALAGIVLSLAIYQWRLVSAASIAQAFRPIHTFLLNKWYFDELYDALFVRSVLRIADAAYWVDRVLVDGLVNLVAASTRGAAYLLRFLQTGRVQQYALVLFAGVLGLLLVWRVVLAG